MVLGETVAALRRRRMWIQRKGSENVESKVHGPTFGPVADRRMTPWYEQVSACALAVLWFPRVVA
eukprot:NODE_26123_length_563_cov_2.509174.p5 GENE.NODE_26123_length_563_cov_2.509174~~NODE_26123_length_563_cov_2.509174.p5  ORF type:complete len:65 (-),score=3.12 NODE_26123_length_563_cov_2.509174:55-249(-)